MLFGSSDKCIISQLYLVSVLQVKLEREVCAEEFSALKALGRVFLRSQGSTIAVGVVTRVHDVQEEVSLGS
jgi:translation elongation factor EF-1alpha